MRSTAQREAAAFPLFFVGLWAVGLFLLWACCLCGFYATASLGLFPRPKRLAGARRRPSQFAMVVASLMGGLVAFVVFLRRRPWACSLAPKDLQGRAGAPRSSQWSLGVAAKAASFNSLAHWASASLFPPLAALGSAPRPGAAAPGTPQKKQPLSRLPAFAPPPPGPTAHPDPAPPPAALPAAVRAIFLYRRPRFLRFLPSAPLASSPNVKNGPQSRSFPFLPRRATPHGPSWDLRRWFWRRPSAPPRPPCSPWPPAGGAAGRFASPKPGPPARASGLAAGASAPPAKRRPPGAAPVQSTAPRFQGILSCLCMHFSTCAIQMSV